MFLSLSLSKRAVVSRKSIIRVLPITSTPVEIFKPNFIASQKPIAKLMSAPVLVGNAENDTTLDNFVKMQEVKAYADLVLQGLISLSLLFMVFYYGRIILGSSGNGQPSFLENKFKPQNNDELTVTFDDVAGCDGAKEELKEIVDFLKNPKKYTDIGAKIPKGCLLTGGPGLGKTLLAKAIAGEADVPFFAISASEFVQLFVGAGALKIRNLFKKAKETSPCIIFIDEIDAIGKKRSTTVSFNGGNDEREQAINQLLTEMDGFESNKGIVVIGATNRSDILDEALVRPGRFDRQILLELPNVKAREDILKVHSRGKPFKEGVEMKDIARITSGFSGAELANLLNEAAIFAARKCNTMIEMDDVENALERIILGLEKRNSLISPEKKLITAYHEAGHTIVAYKIGEFDNIKKVTIIPRGNAGGLTMFEANESGLYKKEYLENQLAVALGGRVAEFLILGENVTTGAQSDLQRVQHIARDMIMKYGFSNSFGHVGWYNDYSDETCYRIDNEVMCLSNTAYERAKEILLNNRDLLDKVAALLIEKETINLKDIIELET